MPKNDEEGNIRVKKFERKYTDLEMHKNNFREPDFNNLLKILNRKKPDRFTLFEFFLSYELSERLAGEKIEDTTDAISKNRVLIKAFRNAGYDYCTLHGSDFGFESGRHLDDGKVSVSMNKGSVIHDRKSFNEYKWPDPESYDYSRLDKLKEYLPDGMKLIVYGNNGVLETVIALVGYEDLCFMIADDPDLVQKIFDAVGSRFVKYYEICAKYDSVGALISNDDWGFNTQTMLNTDDMRKYVFPWHKKIVEAIHKCNKPAILHSCGRLMPVMDDIIDDMKYDAKHSFEDNILPVEKAYENYSERIAILGGLDLDFVCRFTPEEVYNRASSMLELSEAKGGYALGTGNSIPDYVPDENYLAMIAAARWNKI